MMRKLDLRWLSCFFDDDAVSVSRYTRVPETFNRTDVSDYFWEIVVENVERTVPSWCEESAGRFNLVETSSESIVRVPFAIRRHEKVSGVNFEDSRED